MTPFIKFLVFLVIGCALGYFSAHWIISGTLGALTVQKAGWTLWSRAGLSDADPYTNAHFALRRELPLSTFEEMTFRSTQDADGLELNSGCNYEISSSVIPARAWSLSIARPSGEAFEVRSGRTSFNQSNVVRQQDGSFNVNVSPSAEGGNWLPLSISDSTFALSLSLINPERKFIEDPEAISLPLIKQVSCR